MRWFAKAYSWRHWRLPSGSRLSTRQVWVLQAVADGRVDRDPIYGDLAPHMLGGRSVSCTITGLALRGYVGFEPMLPSCARITPRGLLALRKLADR